MARTVIRLDCALCGAVDHYEDKREAEKAKWMELSVGCAENWRNVDVCPSCSSRIVATLNDEPRNNMVKFYVECVAELLSLLLPIEGDKRYRNGEWQAKAIPIVARLIANTVHIRYAPPLPPPTPPAPVPKTKPPFKMPEHHGTEDIKVSTVKKPVTFRCWRFDDGSRVIFDWDLNSWIGYWKGTVAMVGGPDGNERSKFSTPEEPMKLLYDANEGPWAEYAPKA